MSAMVPGEMVRPEEQRFPRFHAKYEKNPTWHGQCNKVETIRRPKAEHDNEGNLDQAYLMSRGKKIRWKMKKDKKI